MDVLVVFFLPNVKDQRRPKGVRCIAWLGDFMFYLSFLGFLILYPFHGDDVFKVTSARACILSIICFYCFTFWAYKCLF